MRTKVIYFTLFFFVFLCVLSSIYAQDEKQLDEDANAQTCSPIEAANPVPTDVNDFDDMWNTFDEIDHMRRRMQRMFHDTFKRGKYGNSDTIDKYFTSFEPDIDIKEGVNEYIVMLDLPGMTKETIDINLSDNILYIAGERKRMSVYDEEDETSGYRYFRKERSFGAFKRTIPLPDHILTDNINAEYENGVLIIMIPKKNPEEVEAVTKKIIVT